ncbi:hypothetical protein chiPu_0012249 [Chiloscyllium punctatum]|uniref:Uncharacterized protein n=1 Tax=Chiloscyllium punctatum TaxID=137246 RepID=A0A401STS6_CHIPU|nr:hypothetical protein [Chiloscyllium punctatum]
MPSAPTLRSNTAFLEAILRFKITTSRGRKPRGQFKAVSVLGSGVSAILERKLTVGASGERERGRPLRDGTSVFLFLFGVGESNPDFRRFLDHGSCILILLELKMRIILSNTSRFAVRFILPGFPGFFKS